MKNYLLLFLLFSIINTSWAQNQDYDYKTAVKVYNLTSFEKKTKSLIAISSISERHLIKTNTILNPTIALQWKAKNNNSHEVELTNFRLNVKSNEIVSDSTISNYYGENSHLTSTFLSARYEYIFNAKKQNTKRLKTGFGFGVNPYFSQSVFNSRIPYVFPKSEVSVGARVFFTPRLTYFISSKLFIDFNLPICFFDMYYDFDKFNNPSLPLNQRTVKTFTFENFPSFYSGRIGFGIKI